MELNEKMRASKSALSQANDTAIKNNKILYTKLLKAEKKIKQFDKSIALQQATINNLSLILDKNEARLKVFKYTTSSA